MYPLRNNRYIINYDLVLILNQFYSISISKLKSVFQGHYTKEDTKVFREIAQSYISIFTNRYKWVCFPAHGLIFICFHRLSGIVSFIWYLIKMESYKRVRKSKTEESE